MWLFPGGGCELSESDVNFSNTFLDIIEYFQHTHLFLLASPYSLWTGALALRKISYVDLANYRFGDRKIRGAPGMRPLDRAIAVPRMPANTVSVFIKAPSLNNFDSDSCSQDLISFTSSVGSSLTGVARENYG